MTRTKNIARAPRNAAHAAPDPAPVPGTSPVAGSAAAAVHAALTASPGATTAAIAAAAGIGHPAARDALAALDAAGAVTRTKGGKPGIPDTWTLTAHGRSGNEPAAGAAQEDEHAGTSQPGDDPASGEHDGSGQQETGGAQASADGDPGAAADQAAQPDGEPAEGDPVEGSPAGEDTAASHEQDQTAPPADGRAPAGSPHDPALVAEIAGHIGQIQAACAAATVLAGGGDLHAVRASLDEIYEKAAQARRAAWAAAGGRRPRPPSRAGCARRSWPTCAPTPGAASPRTRSTR